MWVADAIFLQVVCPSFLRQNKQRQSTEGCSIGAVKSSSYHRHRFHHLLLQQNPEWLYNLVLAYPDGRGKGLSKA